MNKAKSSSKRDLRKVELNQPAVVGPWNFHQRVEKGKEVISQAIVDAHWSVKTRAHFDRAIDQLTHLAERSWHKPNPASKIGDHTYVIRFRDVDSKQLRVFGHFYLEHHAFVMTFDGYEKGDVYYPTSYEKMAGNHRIHCDGDFNSRTKPFEKRCKNCNHNQGIQAVS